MLLVVSLGEVIYQTEKIKRGDKMVGMLSDIGNCRKVNEDSVGCFENEDIKIYVIADGMGGHNAGEVASRMAVESTIEYINLNKDNDNAEKLLVDSILYANRTINEFSKTDYKMNGMGTTITACLIRDSNMIVANVGDSSCYVIIDDKITKITKDHSLVQQLVDEGSITELEAVSHPNRNIITRALGTNIELKVDTFNLKIESSYKIILCTDGLSNEVKASEMYDIVINNDNITSCKKLIELSKSRGGRDNISVIVFEGECEDGRNCTGK